MHDPSRWVAAGPWGGPSMPWDQALRSGLAMEPRNGTLRWRVPMPRSQDRRAGLRWPVALADRLPASRWSVALDGCLGWSLWLIRADRVAPTAS